MCFIKYAEDSFKKYAEDLTNTGNQYCKHSSFMQHFLLFK